MTETFPRKTFSEVLQILVYRLLGFLGQLSNRQNGSMNNIGSRTSISRTLAGLQKHVYS